MPTDLKSNSDANLHRREEISFFASGNYSVLIVDMVNSTRTASAITDSINLRRYYSMFFSKIFPIARNFDGKIVKITGDGFICYFPKTVDLQNRDAFRAVVQCGIAMTEARCGLNSDLNAMKLPSTTYRVSADYGNLEIAQSSTSKVEDLFGSTMNVCAKINRFAPANGVVIGGDLYTILKSFGINDYHFEELGSYDLGLRNSYPVYAVGAKTTPNKGASSPSPSVSSHINSSDLIPLTTSQRLPLLEQDNSFGNTNSTDNDNSKHRHHKTDNIPIRNSRYNLMIVDDEPDILQVYKEMLNSERYYPDLFVDPMQALKHYGEVDPAYYGLVILDIRMPVMNGLQLYRRLRSINPNVKVLFITALDAAEELCSVMSEDLSSESIVRKPVRTDKLLNKIESFFPIRNFT